MSCILACLDAICTPMLTSTIARMPPCRPCILLWLEIATMPMAEHSLFPKFPSHSHILRLYLMATPCLTKRWLHKPQPSLHAH
jgi:hypothetical protein